MYTKLLFCFFTAGTVLFAETLVKFDFNNGLPKIQQHDEKPSVGYGLIYKGRLICFYDFECDLGDGWEDESVHNNPWEVRQESLKMGVNIIYFALTQ